MRSRKGTLSFDLPEMPRRSAKSALLTVAAFVSVAFLTGGHCGNEVTAPNATPSPVPAPTPTPAAASVDAYVDQVQGNNLPPVGISGASVSVTQGVNSHPGCVTSSTGHCVISGLVAGPATVTALKDGLGGSTTVTLAAGSNNVEVRLPR